MALYDVVLVIPIKLSNENFNRNQVSIEKSVFARIFLI
ncbi:hypothetical protein LEP1GSC172_2015 [Leptospira noguchii]|uniref:Uncharacterized protein n=1 Tax=Leptospira noguchii TaxID=28182 RepID=M6VUQ3_9LEPT|nr:hypothetical protein LEP1GSC172_2015 [Leptospira noguchii]